MKFLTLTPWGFSSVFEFRVVCVFPWQLLCCLNVVRWTHARDQPVHTTLRAASPVDAESSLCASSPRRPHGLEGETVWAPCHHLLRFECVVTCECPRAPAPRGHAIVAAWVGEGSPILLRDFLFHRMQPWSLQGVITVAVLFTSGQEVAPQASLRYQTQSGFLFFIFCSLSSITIILKIKL